MDNLKFINLETTSSINTDANLVWKNCLTRIKENVTLMTYNTWFLPIRPISINDNNLKVQLPNQSPGDMFYFDGNQWVRIPKGNEGQKLTLINGVPTWID